MIQRSIIKQLISWKKSNHRKPLILRGARQVGKTSVVRILAEQFEHYIELDLDKKEDLAFFEQDLSFQQRLNLILLSKNKTRSEGPLLIFIDEIQNSSQAIAELRYFYEEASDLYVIAAGSLLEILMDQKKISFPVGRIQYLFMYPMTFSEYLLASGQSQLYEVYQQVPYPDYAHSMLLEAFHQYTLLGGMPEVLKVYFETPDLVVLRSLYQGLLTTYINDVSRYAKNANFEQVLRHAIESAPLETGKRIKFEGFGNSAYRSREMGEALRTLERAMLLYLLYPSSTTELPITPNLKKSPRLQFLDTGLLNFSLGLQKEFYGMQDLHELHRGMIAEHIVGQELLALDPLSPQKVSFWTREAKQAQSEVDFLWQHGKYVIPVEVKSGSSGRLRSLHQFMKQSPYPYAVRLSAGPLSIQKSQIEDKAYSLLNIPYFLAGQLPNYLDLMMSDK